MAEYIVTSTRTKPNGAVTATVIVRVDVPVGNNDVAVPWQTALAQYRVDQGKDGTTAWPGGTTTELDSGAKHEFAMEHRDNKDKAGLVTRLEAAVLAEETAERDRLSDLLRYWGRTGTVT